MDLSELKASLAKYRYRFDTESDLQERVAAALSDLDLAFDREFVLDPQNRIDFLVGGIGIEIKTNSTLAQVSRQVHRYLSFDPVESLLLVTTKTAHKGIVRTMQDKSLDVLVVGGIL
jgi:hypothetical protein